MDAQMRAEQALVRAEQAEVDALLANLQVATERAQQLHVVLVAVDATITDLSVTHVPPTVPATAANTVMPLPLAASGPVGAVIPYDPAIPVPGPLAAPTVVNQRNATDAAFKAAEAERKKRERLEAKKRTRVAAGLPAVAVKTAEQLRRKDRNDRHRQKQKMAKTAQRMDADSDE
jgi:hypothetical protein